jgi:hypothetical protein
VGGLGVEEGRWHGGQRDCEDGTEETEVNRRVEWTRAVGFAQGMCALGLFAGCVREDSRVYDIRWGWSSRAVNANRPEFQARAGRMGGKVNHFDNQQYFPASKA